MRKNRAFYQKVKHFQYKVTMKWRGAPNEVNVIIPPVSPHDETTNTGAAKIILSLFTIFGNLESTSTTNETAGDIPDVINLRLANDLKDRYLIMVGDGLTQIRARQFSDLIEESSASYRLRHQTTMMIQKALDQVIFI